MLSRDDIIELIALVEGHLATLENQEGEADELEQDISKWQHILDNLSQMLREEDKRMRWQHYIHRLRRKL